MALRTRRQGCPGVGSTRKFEGFPAPRATELLPAVGLAQQHGGVLLLFRRWHNHTPRRPGPASTCSLGQLSSITRSFSPWLRPGSVDSELRRHVGGPLSDAAPWCARGDAARRPELDRGPKADACESEWEMSIVPEVSDRSPTRRYQPPPEADSEAGLPSRRRPRS